MQTINPRRKILFLITITLLVLPVFAQAKSSSYGAPALWPTGYWGPLVSCTGDYSAGNQYPCQSLCDLVQTIINIVYFGMTIALFVLAPISFVIGGIMYMISGGNPGKAQNAKKVLLGTVIGIAIVLGAFLIINTFVGLITGNSSFLGSVPCT